MLWESNNCTEVHRYACSSKGTTRPFHDRERHNLTIDVSHVADLARGVLVTKCIVDHASDVLVANLGDSGIEVAGLLQQKACQRGAHCQKTPPVKTYIPAGDLAIIGLDAKGTAVVLSELAVLSVEPQIPVPSPTMLLARISQSEAKGDLSSV